METEVRMKNLKSCARKRSDILAFYLFDYEI